MNQHLYMNEPECALCGHYGPNDDPAESCVPPERRIEALKAARERAYDRWRMKRAGMEAARAWKEVMVLDELYHAAIREAPMRHP